MASKRADKWVLDVRPGDLVSKAARRALRDRLRYLWSQLKLAAKEPEKNPEYVHQTRVASRRTIAALDTFQELLPKKRVKKIRKSVRKIRKAASHARDDDVLLMRLDALINSGTSPGLESWRAEVQAQRQLHQGPIGEIYRQLRKSDFKRQTKKLLKRIQYRSASKEPTYQSAAIKTIKRQYAAFGLILSGKVPPLEQLHPLRIAVKQLRYELELFAGAFPDGRIRKDVYPKVSELQELLGHVNDYHTALARLEKWQDSHPESQEALYYLIQEEQASLQSAREAFIRWWEAGAAKEILKDLKSLSTPS